MVHPGPGGGGDDRLGVEGDAEPGGLDHGEVVGAVAHRERGGQRQPALAPRVPAAWPAWRRGRGSAPPPCRCSAAPSSSRVLERCTSKPSSAATRPVKKVKPPETSAVSAPCARMVATSSRAPGVQSVRCPGLLQRVDRQALQHGDALAQRGREVDLAVHARRVMAAICSLRRRRRRAISSSVSRGDDGAVHVGDQQALAAAAPLAWTTASTAAPRAPRARSAGSGAARRRRCRRPRRARATVGRAAAGGVARARAGERRA